MTFVCAILQLSSIQDSHISVWNSVKVDLTGLKGKKIDKILFSYDAPALAKGTVFRGFVDDVAVEQADTLDDSDGLISYVDTRRGTKSLGGFSRGNNFPAAA